MGKWLQIMFRDQKLHFKYNNYVIKRDFISTKSKQEYNVKTG